jgi:isoleucyl-tRNA synthetase
MRVSPLFRGFSFSRFSVAGVFPRAHEKTTKKRKTHFFFFVPDNLFLPPPTPGNTTQPTSNREQDPKEILEAHGADALRLYLINSPVVRAEPLRFQEAGVREVVKVVFLPWYNAYRFLVQSARRWEADQTGDGGGEKATWRPDPAAAAASPNVLDRWLLASSRELARFVTAEMGAYRLYTVVPRLTRFIADLTNVYVRYNRGRLKGRDSSGAAAGDDDDDEGEGADAGADAAAAAVAASLSASEEEDRTAALSTLHAVLTELCVVMAPFTPFLCELMWRNLRRALVDDKGGDGGDETEDEERKPPASEELHPASVHWAPFPSPTEDRAGDDEVRRGVEAMQRAIELARTVRERGVRPLRQPLRSMVIVHPDPAVLALLTREFSFFLFSAFVLFGGSVSPRF